MNKFVPFGVSKTAQDIITEHLNTPKTPSTGVFRNPHFDLRTEQGLPPDALYPDPLLDFSATEDLPVDPCPAGYELIDGICQPIEKFGQSLYQPNPRDDNEPEERDYMSIKEMSEASDYELLKYLDDGWLKGDKFNATIGGTLMPPAFALPFGGTNK